MNKLKYCIYILITLTTVFISCKSEKKKKEIKPYVVRYYNGDSLGKDPNGYGKRKAEEIKRIISKLAPNDTTLYAAYSELGDCVGLNKQLKANYYLKAIEVAKRTKNEEWLIRDAYDIIDVFQAAGLTEKALSLAYENLEYGYNEKDTVVIYAGLIKICSIYNEAKEYENQLKYSNQLMAVVDNYTNFDSIRLTSKVIGKQTANTYKGIALMQLGLTDSALYYLQKAYQMSISQSQAYQIIPLANLGDINANLNQHEIAISYYKKALDICYQIMPYERQIKSGIANSLSTSFFQLHKLDSSLKYSNIAFTYAKERTYLIGQIDAAKTLTEIYKIQKRNDSMYHYQNIYYTLKDSVFSDEKKKNITKKAAEEFAKQNDKLESERKEEQERTTNLQLGLIAIFIPTFASAVYFISKKRKKNSKIITILGLASLLMLFEFISLLIHPHIERLTHHNPMMMYLILLIIASILVPLHHKLEGYVKSKL
jgi:hypothetical protein